VDHPIPTVTKRRIERHHQPIDPVATGLIEEVQATLERTNVENVGTCGLLSCGLPPPSGGVPGDKWSLLGEPIRGLVLPRELDAASHA
jgi:hypothetical protein